MYTNKTYILYVGIFAFYPCHGFLETVELKEQLIRGENLAKQLVHLLKRIRLEFPYDYVVIVKDVQMKSSCLFEDSIGYLDEPIILLSDLSQHLLQQQHSNKFLLLACSAEYLNQLNIFNTVYQYVPHIIWYQTFEEVQATAEMSKLCSSINKNGYFQNLIITPQSLDDKETYFNCNLQKHLEPISSGLLANPFLNMQGLPLITESDQLPPRSVLFYNKVGELKLTGFVGNFLTTFAKRYNASLQIVPPADGDMGVTVFYELLSNKTFQGLLDIAATAIPFKMDTFSGTFSYPMELMEYCYMIPLPHIRPPFKVFFEIIELEAMLIILCYFFIYGLLLNIGQHHKMNVANILLNDKSMRGMLGQSFVMPKKTSLFMKYICFLLCYTSILICTSYQAYLQSHLVHPPLEKRMETYEDIRTNNYKILIDGRESAFIYPEILEKHHDLFVKEINFDKFLKTRHNMDTRYIYPVSQTRWFVFNERQKLFQRKLFYYSSQLCLNNLVLLSFPLRPGLPYRYQFDQHLLDVRDTGLLAHWLDNNFLMMVRLKLSSFKDLSVADEYGEVLLLIDYLWIWILYAACILLSTLVFVGELIFYKVFKIISTKATYS